MLVLLMDLQPVATVCEIEQVRVRVQAGVVPVVQWFHASCFYDYCILGKIYVKNRCCLLIL